MSTTVGNHDPLLEEIRYDGSIVKRDRSRRIARHMMLQHRVRIQSSREFDPTWVHWFKRRSTGRRCSCWSLEASPRGDCGVCFGEGIVGPWEKFGYESLYLDASRQNVRCVNVLPLPELQQWPVPFGLAPFALRGFVEVTLPFRPSKGLDMLQLVAKQSDGSRVTGYVRAPLEAEFVELTVESLESRLPAGGGSLVFRFEIERTRLDDDCPVPVLSHMMIRHQVSDRILVPIDIPRQNENVQLSDLGAIEIFSSLRAWVTWEYGKFSPEDFFVTVGSLPESTIRSLSRHMAALETKHQYDMSDKVSSEKDVRDRLGVINGLLKTDRVSPRLKITGSEVNEAIGVTTSYDLDLRNINKHEFVYRFPV